MPKRGPRALKTRMFPDGRATLVGTFKTLGAANTKANEVRKSARARITPSIDGFKVWKGDKRK